ncbi:WD repeat-containing protein-like protein [Lineolata rhizophorae]|uniref:WD repeat-containing protein-like protein n=1 Tax=Lineolata rhizophorae TaxID=578093 RepID=A0A6A6P7V4_9PEZI|nr:WD repeat-containing protein-like protein [Lineolata rhizophorae]
MVKSYLKYEHSQTFGTVTSATSNAVWARDASGGTRATGAGRAFVGANEEVLSWDVKKGELLSRWRDSRCSAQVTAIAQSKADRDVFAVGYADGSIRIWDSRIDSAIISFNGHKSAITILDFDSAGVRLVSGARDTDVIVWDLVSEVGLFRLRGHKGQVTGLAFLPIPAPTAEYGSDGQLAPMAEATQDFLLSTGKDALIKLWDLSSQHCIETHVAQSNGECWSMDVSPDGSGCITGGNDGEIRVWAIDLEGLYASSTQPNAATDQRYLYDRGALNRQGKDRTTGVSFHPSADYFAVHGSEKAVEIWRIRSEGEVQRALARKRKRRREKAAASGDVEMEDGDNVDGIASAQIGDVFVPYVVVRTGGKVRSMEWAPGSKHKSIQLLVAMTNNLLDVYDVPTKSSRKSSKGEEPPEYSRTYSVDLPGHRTDVRSLALSSDDRMLASASSGALKIWNVRTQTCLRTLECGYALCCSFLPGDKIVVVGTKGGELELFDIASSSLIESAQAHDGAIWTMQVHPGGQSIVTGSADRSAKFWDFKIVQEEIPGTKRTTPRLKLVHKRTLKLNDDILNLCFSPDSRLLAVSTLDNTVKVFFVDTLKLFLNLYGHKLPVLNISISSDSKLIATCSADKNVRLWGLDFGDCHRAFFAHDDSVMQVAFVPHPISADESHYFFSASKDHALKRWDGDKFELIQKLGAHHGEVWAMAVARTGDFVATAAHDKSIRLWHQTDEPLFLEEERERELEQLYESTLAANLDDDGGANVAGDDEDDTAGPRDELAAASKQTVETLTAGERIVEALEVGMADLAVARDWERRAAAAQQAGTSIAPPQRDPLFLALGGISAERHVLNVLSKVPPGQLHDALLVLPFSAVPSMFTFISIWVRKGWNVPLACRVLFFLLKTHQKQIVASREMKELLEEMREGLRETLNREKDTMGFNIAALRFIGDRVRESGIGRLEDVREQEMLSGRKKRGFVDVA